MKNYVITIARGFGSGGKEIAGKLAKELGIPCYERQILSMASEQSGVSEALFAEVDEKLKGSYLINCLKKVPFSTVVEPSDKDFTSNVNLYNIQAEIITKLASTQSCIIVGKCADHILANRNNVIRIFIEAPREDCIASIMEKMMVSREEANRLINKTDNYRSDYYRYYTSGKRWKNPDNYDFILNSSMIGRDRCVKLIKDYVKIKFEGKLVVS